MTDLIALHRRAVDGFGRVVQAVRDDQWHAPTPDSDWDVHDLVNHLVGECLWTAPLLAGQTIADVGDRFDGDLLGDDPPAAWSAAAEDATAASAQGGHDALARTVHVSFGDISGEEYLSQLTADHTIHAWDLARAIGADEQLDPELVEFTYGFMAPQADQLRSVGVFGPAVDPPPGADRQTELLCLTGRSP
jgi:uncharacterized protein (TIGR03086 family)